MQMSPRSQQRPGLGQRSLKKLIIAEEDKKAPDAGAGVKKVDFSPSSLLESPVTLGNPFTYISLMFEERIVLQGSFTYVISFYP